MGDAKVVPTKPSTLPEVGFGRRKVAAVAATKLLARKKKATLLAPKPPLTYQYHVGKGNNSRLILQALRKRPWFVPRNDSSKQRASLSGRCTEIGSGLKGRRTASRATTSSTTPAWSIKMDCIGRCARTARVEGREPMDQFMPLTFHVTTLEDEEWTSFKAAFVKHSLRSKRRAPRTSGSSRRACRTAGSAFAWRTTWRYVFRRPSLSVSRRGDGVCESALMRHRRGERPATPSARVWYSPHAIDAAHC